MRLLKKYLFAVVLLLQDKSLFIIGAGKKNQTAHFQVETEKFKIQKCLIYYLFYILYIRKLGRKIRHEFPKYNQTLIWLHFFILRSRYVEIVEKRSAFEISFSSFLIMQR